MTPKVSVVMSTFCRNRKGRFCPNMLRRAIESILIQTFRDFELILIDDGSTDGSQQVCEEYAASDQRIRYFRKDRNSGLPAKMYNEGMKLAKADFFCHMFDDDEWYQNALADLYEGITVTHFDCGMVYGTVKYVDVRTGWTTTVGSEWNLEQLRTKIDFCILGANSVILRKSVIDMVGGFDESPLFRRVCDWDLWVRIGMKFPVAKIDKTIGCQNQGERDSIGRTVLINEDTWRVILAVQASSNRKLNLQGEWNLGLSK